MPQRAVLARVRVKDGMVDDYLAAFRTLLEQASSEPGILLYLLHRSRDDPQVFWTSELYADDEAFAAHTNSDAHTTTTPIFTSVIAEADVSMGDLVVGKL